MEKQLKLPQAFAELGIETPILQALAAMGYEEPSPIQRELIPHVLAGRDVLGQARTGTGKTASFGIPICQQVDPNGR
ncbi:MAG: DEAD/DEAH box helicase, partial [Phycisphaerales bacterium]|nr:DEAD/DEAH box helicase [Phycisphaerales bacterium]